VFLVLLLYALFASVFTIAKTGLLYTQPLFFVGTRMALAGLFLMGYHFYKQKSFQFSLNKSTLFKIVKLALFNIYLTNIFEFWGLQHLTSFKTCFIYSLSPFISALFSYFIFSEKLSSRKWIGLMIGFMGIMPILLNDPNGLETDSFIISWPELAVIMAAICSVYGWIILKQLMKDSNCTPVVANGMSMLIGGIISLFHSYFMESWNPLPVTEWVPFLDCALLLIIISNLVCYNLYGYLLKKHSATFMSFAGFSTPFFTAFFGWIFLNEVIGWPFYLSSIIVLGGLFIFYQEELQQEYLVAKT
jgi:drug/metabolite transporter (DMT)-like permease